METFGVVAVFFRKGGADPRPLHRVLHTDFRNYSTTPYKRNTKINPKGTPKLATARYTYNPDEGGGTTRTDALTLHTNAHHQKTEGHTKPLDSD